MRFVVQQHSATTLHYDFRLEVDGVLRAWAVPKGPSTDPAEKRLAVQVDDHSLEAGEFEGVHEGQRRGTGAVIIWDQGTYVPLTEDFATALDGGHASFLLEGAKLSGGWTLHRTGGTQGLLIKRRDGEAGRELWPESVRSGRTIDEL
jgi:DNA ligase D-like protein (predicted 3'-phosphoesterase)